MNQEKIGKFIADRRKIKGITQKELAEKLGVTDKTVSRWENGHYLPDVSLFNDICTILEIEVTELLKGEKLKDYVDKEAVDKTIMQIVDISSDEIKKNKKKITIISLLSLAFIIIIFGILLLLKKDNKFNNEIKVGDPVYLPSQMAIKEKDDGWVCYFYMEYFQNDLKTPYWYSYNCDNFKYKELDDYYVKGVESDGNGEYTYKIGINHPQYIHNDIYDEDLDNIQKYFEEKKFNSKITTDDLDGLKLKHISKDEVLELFNKAISSPKKLKYGNMVMLNQYPSYMNVSNKYDDYTWSVGYLLNSMHIQYIHIELMIDNKYLSDLIVNNEATEEQKNIYNNIKKIEEYVIKEQKFELPKELENIRPYNFLSENFSNIRNLGNE